MDQNVIQSVFEKYGSDKAQHGYAKFYAKHLPANPSRILEIGVKEGASIRAWKELFPNAEIHGLDLFKEFPVPDIPGITFHQGNQCDWRLLERLRQYNFDIIIDDGSHNARDQMMSFYGLAKKGCTYFFEDLHCLKEDFYLQELPVYVSARYIFLMNSTEWTISEGFKMQVVCL